MTERGHINITTQATDLINEKLLLWWESDNISGKYKAGLEYHFSNTKPGKVNCDFVSNPIEADSEREAVMNLLKKSQNEIDRMSNFSVILSDFICLYDFCKKQNIDERSFSFICHQD